MNTNFIDNFLFGEDAKKTSQKEKKIWYFSLVGLLIFLLFFIKNFIVFLIQNYSIISVIVLVIYVIYGIKKSSWVKGIQGILLSIFFISIFLGVKAQENSYFLNLKKCSDYHYTDSGVGEQLWYNLKVKDDNTYEIQLARPVDGNWTETKKGKTSKLTKQRFTDSGKEYYCFYLENYPFENERTMVAFENAFSTTILKFDSGFSLLLSDGSNDNPWD
jgi:hypothetical protein